MKIISKLILAILLMTFAQTAEAQFLNKLKNRVKNGMEEAVLRKTEDKAIEKTENAMDSVFTESPKSTDNNADTDAEAAQAEADVNAMLGGLLGGGGEVKTEEEYTFSITADIMVENYTKNKTQSNKIIQSYGKDATLNIVDEAPGPLISDFVNNTTIMLNEETKVAQVMSMDWLINMMGSDTEDADNEDVDLTMTKTGKTKTLNGYTCHEYLIKTEESEIYSWYAPDVPFNYEDYLSGFSKMFGKQVDVSKIPAEHGYVMELTVFEKGKKLYYFIVTDLSETTKTVDMSEYQIQKMF